MLRRGTATFYGGSSRPYDPPRILWYFGAITAALMANATALSVSPAARGAYQLVVALLFLGALVSGSLLLLRAGWVVPGGVLAAAAVALVPAVGQGVERLLGIWPDGVEDVSFLLQGGFEDALFALGLATIAAGIAAYALTRFPFVLAPAAVAVVLTVQLAVPAFVDDPTPDDHAGFFIGTGAVLVLLGLVLDALPRRPQAFWWHATGLFAVALGLAWHALLQDRTWAWIAIPVLGLVLVVASAPLARATWTTYGLVGLYGAVLHYAIEWVGSWKQPALMLVASLALLVLGIALHADARAWASRSDAPPPDDAGSPMAA